LLCYIYFSYTDIIRLLKFVTFTINISENYGSQLKGKELAHKMFEEMQANPLVVVERAFLSSEAYGLITH